MRGGGSFGPSDPIRHLLEVGTLPGHCVNIVKSFYGYVSLSMRETYP